MFVAFQAGNRLFADESGSLSPHHSRRLNLEKCVLGSGFSISGQGPNSLLLLVIVLGLLIEISTRQPSDELKLFGCGQRLP
jgi:hypothetical protein